mgnify:CR=1 FL=1
MTGKILGRKDLSGMRPENYMIEEWTVAEYMCLVDARWVGVFFRREDFWKKQGIVLQNWILI